MYPGLPFFDVPLYSFVIKGYRPCVFFFSKHTCFLKSENELFTEAHFVLV